MATLVTAGGSTVGAVDYVAAAAMSDGSLLVAYVPPAHSGTITVSLAVMAGTTRSRWLDPTTGLYALDATGLANAGTHVFTPPGTNSQGLTDWLLVCDVNAAAFSGITVNLNTTFQTLVGFGVADVFSQGD